MSLPFRFCLLAFFCGYQSLFGQNEPAQTPPLKHLSITWVATDLIYPYIRFDISQAIGKNFGVALGLKGKPKQTEKFEDAEISYNAIGLNLIPKYYLQGVGRRYFALDAALVQNNYSYTFYSEQLVPVVVDGVTYYMFGIVGEKGAEPVYNPKLSIIYGIENIPKTGIFAFEVFFGMGYRWAIYNGANGEALKSYDNGGIASPFYQGITAVFGVKIGAFVY